MGSLRAAALLLGTVCSAYLLSLSLRVESAAWVSLPAILPLFVAIHTGRSKLALSCGCLWGASVFAFMRGDFSQFWMLLAVPGVYAWVSALATRRVGFNPLVVGVGWMLVELALLRPLGLKEGLLGGAFGHGPVTDLVGGFFGYVLLAFAAAFIGACIVAAISDFRLCLPGREILITPDEVSGRLWHVIATAAQWFVVGPHRPRAPPRF